MPFIDRADTLFSELPVAPRPEVESIEEVRPDASAVLGAAFRQNNIVSSLYERLTTEGLDTFTTPPRVEDYDPFTDISGFEDFAERFVRSGSPAETLRIKERIRSERTDRDILRRAGGWGVASSMAAGVIDPITIGSMLIPVAPGLAGASRGTRIAAGVGGQIAFDSTVEAMLHSAQELRTPQESAFNVGAGALLVGALGTVATRVPKKDLDKAREALREDLRAAVNTEGSTVGAAARGTETTLADEGIAKGGQALAATMGQVSPVTRVLQAPVKSARILAQRLADVPYVLGKHLKGIAGPRSVESMVKRLTNIGRWQTVKMTDDAFTEYKKAGGPLSRKQFSKEISKALTRGDVSEIPQVMKVVSWARETFEADKKLLRELGVEVDDAVIGAKSYFPRVYDFAKIIANRADFENRLFQWFKANPKVDTKAAAKLEGVEAAGPAPPRVLEDAEIRDEVQNVLDHILGMPSSKADINLRSKAAPLKSRVLDVPDDILEPFMVRDFETVMAGYFRSMAPEISMRKTFGSTDLKNEIDEVKQEFRIKIEAAKDNAAKEVLRKQETDAIQDLLLLRDRLMGDTGPRGGQHVNWVRAARVARLYNYTRLLGSQMLSSIPDYGRLVARYGLARTLTRTASFLTNWNLNKLSRAEAHRMGTALEVAVDTRSAQIGDIAEELPTTRFDQGMHWIGNTFSRVSLMSPWNATMKTLTTILEQDSLIRSLQKGKLSKFQTAQLARAGIGEEEGKRILKMFAKHGEEVGGTLRARTELWEDVDAARLVEDSVLKVADEMIVTRGIGDLPAMMDRELVKTLLQFKSFAISSVNRTMIPIAQGLAHGDARTAQGLMTMMTLGMAVYYTKEFAAGRQPNTSPDRLIAEAMNWSGTLGYLPEIWDPIAGLHEDLPRFSRFQSRSPTESALGPTFGTSIDTVYGTLAGMLDGEIEQKDIGRMRRLLPMQSLFYTRRLFNAIEGEVGEAVNAEGSTVRTFGERITEETPTK